MGFERRERMKHEKCDKIFCYHIHTHTEKMSKDRSLRAINYELPVSQIDIET